MIPGTKTSIKRFLAKWAIFVTSYPKSILLAAILLTAAAGIYAAGHLGVITDTSVMLSKRLNYLQVYRHFKKEFPHSYNQIVIVIEAITPDLAADARDRLGKALRTRKELFPWVYLPGDDTFFKKEGLLFLSPKRLENLADNLARTEPILAALMEEPDLQGFFSMLSMAIDARQKGQPIDLTRIFSELDRTFEHINTDRFYQLSWMRLMSGTDSSSDNRQFIIVQPNVNYKKVLPGRLAISTIKNISNDLGLVPERGVKVLLTGDIPMQYDELKSVTTGAKTAGILSFVMVSIVLVTGLGSIRLVMATLAPLVAGLVWTACFAALAVGHLNMISVAFAVLFIGLAVDYAIHLCLRYRELLTSGIGSTQAIITAVQDVGPSLVLCALTTSIGFYSFMPTDFSGVAELGLISGTGMFIGLFANLTLIPAIVTLFPLSATSTRPYYLQVGNRPLFLKLLAVPYKRGKIIRALAIALTLAAFWYVPKLRFDSNPINLRDPNSESIIAFKKLLEAPNSSPWSLESLAATGHAALERAKRFEKLHMVKHALTLESFIPKDQDEKLDIIYDMGMIMEPVISAPLVRRHPETPQRELKSLETFARKLQELPERGSKDKESACVQHLRGQIESFTSRLKSLDVKQQAAQIQRLRKALLGSFPGRIKELELALSASPVTEKDLPADIRSEWIGISGTRRVEIVPRKNPASDREIYAWIQEARTVDPDVTGYAVLIIEGGRAVLHAFKKAFTLSLAAIALLLLVLIRKKRDAVIIFFSLVLAGLLTAGLMVLTGLELNFANIIALPLILGIGVDNGIHIVHRHRQALKEPATILQTSTARAIFFSTLTTVCSFGNLAVSPHLGMASMGKLLTIGISMALVTAILVIPAFLAAYCRCRLG